MLVEELFHPTDEENQDSTEMMENVLVLVLLLSLKSWKTRRRQHTNTFLYLVPNFPMTIALMT